MSLDYLYAFFCTLVYVFSRSFQQKNVQHSKYWFILPTSMVMGVLDVVLITKAAQRGLDWKLCVAFGLGGGIGSIIAVFIHNHFIHKVTT